LYREEKPFCNCGYRGIHRVTYLGGGHARESACSGTGSL
jgi:hypothetical protein